MQAQQTLPGGFPVTDFLQKYWQKSVYFHSAAWPVQVLPFSAEELAGLACEDDVAARLGIRNQDAIQMEDGPFAEARFASLPDSHWTLQVFAVQQHIAELALWMDAFNFLPNWRLDRLDGIYLASDGQLDSPAVPEDRFILQLTGEQSVRITEARENGQQENAAQEEDADTRILKGGDLLYLPAGHVHTARCMAEHSLSVELHCHAPAVGELLGSFCRDAMSKFELDQLYCDDDLPVQKWPGEIATDARMAIRSLIRSLPMEDADIDDWFASHVTDLRPGEYLPEPGEELRPKKFHELFRKHKEVWRSEYARFSHFTDKENILYLYVAGERFVMHGSGPQLARLLASQRMYRYKDLQDWLQDRELLEFLTDLYNMGAVYFQEE